MRPGRTGCTALHCAQKKRELASRSAPHFQHRRACVPEAAALPLLLPLLLLSLGAEAFRQDMLRLKRCTSTGARDCGDNRDASRVPFTPCWSCIVELTWLHALEALAVARCPPRTSTPPTLTHTFIIANYLLLLLLPVISPQPSFFGKCPISSAACNFFVCRCRFYFFFFFCCACC